VKLTVRGAEDFSSLRSIGYPHTYKDLKVSNTDTVADNAWFIKNVTQSDWGEGKDYYVYGVVVFMNNDSNFMTLDQEGIKLILYNSTQDRYVFAETITSEEKKPVQQESTFLLLLTKDFNPRKVPAGSTLSLRIGNFTGVSFGAGSIVMWPKGYTI